VFEAHRHDTPHLCLATRGRWCEHCHGTSALIEPGTVVLHHAEAEHAGMTGAVESRCVHLEFDASWLGRFAPWRAAGMPSRIAHDGLARALAAAIAAEVAAHDAFTATGAAALLDELLPRLHDAAMTGAAARPRARSRDRLVPEAMRLLRARHREPVTVRDVADALDTDPATLVRAVRRTLGLTPGEVVRRHRARTALTLLAADRGRGALSRIAADAGFADQSHMTRTLRRLHGITPGTAQRLSRVAAPA
jgi:AraC-like DNA-binding protein